MNQISKSRFIEYKKCHKNAWLLLHRSDLPEFKRDDASEASKKAGNEVDDLAQEYFPGGLEFKIGDVEGALRAVRDRVPVLYQPPFKTELYRAIPDILVWDTDREVYDLYEVKSNKSNSVIDDKGKKKDAYRTYVKDVGFQVHVLLEAGVPLGDKYILVLDKDYSFDEALEVDKFFKPIKLEESDFPTTLAEEMRQAHEYLTQEVEPEGGCECLYKTRSNHCQSFAYSNFKLPKDSIYNIPNLSAKKLKQLLDEGVKTLGEVPTCFPLSESQKLYVEGAKRGESVDEEALRSFLDTIKFPISFLDYESCGQSVSIPRFNGFQAYEPMPFQYSLHVLHEDGRLEHREFLHREATLPDRPFLDALKADIPKEGSVVAWNASYEMSANENLARRNPEYKDFLKSLNERVIDLMKPFKDRHWVHLDFEGSASIQDIFPVLCGEGYSELSIQGGSQANVEWYRITLDKDREKVPLEEQNQVMEDLLQYCKLDTKAMFQIYTVIRDRVVT